ncbi:MAG: hypothetical protein EOO09_11830 [Chitinophagaceae bacterium]|nr:MAG: hypothetical protein EOO09_11830 [Chitinophagaceae bacterium]
MFTTLTLFLTHNLGFESRTLKYGFAATAFFVFTTLAALLFKRNTKMVLAFMLGFIIAIDAFTVVQGQQLIPLRLTTH